MNTLIHRLIDLIFLQPFYAIFSRQFYGRVMTQIRGFGILYTFCLCCLGATVSGTALYVRALNFTDTELPVLMNQLPPFTIDQDGKMSFAEKEGCGGKAVCTVDQQGRRSAEIKLHDGTSVLLFSPENAENKNPIVPNGIEDSLNQITFHISMYHDNVQFYNGVNTTSMTYHELGLVPGKYTPANMQDMVSFYIKVMGLTLLVFFMLMILLIKQTINIGITLLFTIIYFMIKKATITFSPLAFRLAAYANTAVLVIFVIIISFFPSAETLSAVNNPIILLIPFVYIIFAERDMRKFVLDLLLKNKKNGKIKDGQKFYFEVDKDGKMHNVDPKDVDPENNNQNDNDDEHNDANSAENKTDSKDTEDNNSSADSSEKLRPINKDKQNDSKKNDKHDDDDSFTP